MINYIIIRHDKWPICLINMLFKQLSLFQAIYILLVS